ncbi:helix-turn-helix transcriptional regulator [Mycolicibacterium mengxianglii]|uniref:helix-turn-helix transcriptional regulator n=1 Tax=Mycolicibacterium mengxianglii TaxID=2736649 RepID=UPI001E6411C6|nr:helix-turn-helix transcriptional regulator [Mycolicibacterium mengxianglii]
MCGRVDGLDRGFLPPSLGRLHRGGAPGQWEKALRSIHHTVGGTAGALLRCDGPFWSIESSILPADAARSYATHYCHTDHVLAEVQRGAVGTIRTGAELIDPYRHSAFYTEWLHPHRLDDGLFVRLGDGCQPRCLAIWSPRLTVSFDTPERMAAMRGLVPHLLRANRIRDDLAALKDHTDDLASAIGTVRHGIFVVDRNHRLVTMNSGAERILRAEDGLCLRSSRVVAAHPSVDRELRSAIAAAVTGSPCGVQGAQSFTCLRPSGKRPYVVHVLPSYRRATALLLVVDPAEEPEPAIALLRRLYRLTETEAEVALHVMHGSDVKQIAELLSVSLATVRTHVQHIFDKTGTHRQAELVHLLHVVTL